MSTGALVIKVVGGLAAATFFVVFLYVAGAMYRELAAGRWPRIVAFAAGLLWPIIVVFGADPSGPLPRARLRLRARRLARGCWKDEP